MPIRHTGDLNMTDYIFAIRQRLHDITARDLVMEDVELKPQRRMFDAVDQAPGIDRGLIGSINSSRLAFANLSAAYRILFR